MLIGVVFTWVGRRLNVRVLTKTLLSSPTASQFAILIYRVDHSVANVGGVFLLRLKTISDLSLLKAVYSSIIPVSEGRFSSLK